MKNVIVCAKCPLCNEEARVEIPWDMSLQPPGHPQTGHRLLHCDKCKITFGTSNWYVYD